MKYCLRIFQFGKLAEQTELIKLQKIELEQLVVSFKTNH